MPEKEKQEIRTKEGSADSESGLKQACNDAPHRRSLESMARDDSMRCGQWVLRLRRYVKFAEVQGLRIGGLGWAVGFVEVGAGSQRAQGRCTVMCGRGDAESLLSKPTVLRELVTDRPYADGRAARFVYGACTASERRARHRCEEEMVRRTARRPAPPESVLRLARVVRASGVRPRTIRVSCVDSDASPLQTRYNVACNARDVSEIVAPLARKRCWFLMGSRTTGASTSHGGRRKREMWRCSMTVPLMSGVTALGGCWMTPSQATILKEMIASEQRAEERAQASVTSPAALFINVGLKLQARHEDDQTQDSMVERQCLGADIKKWHQQQQHICPQVIPFVFSEPDKSPEWEKLFLPSDFTSSKQTKLGLETLGVEELKLTKIRDVQTRIQNYVKKYRHTRAAMIALGCNPGDLKFLLPELRDEDLYTKNVDQPHNLGDGGKRRLNMSWILKESNGIELVRIWSDGKKLKFWGRVLSCNSGIQQNGDCLVWTALAHDHEKEPGKKSYALKVVGMYQ
ncbi:hypothetical protein C8R45DRAFT_946873 [Mycena sanguinolenta]|nr:hypothetical protein C8R45DRAFT_946873 [Mycena sanguinolenta]